MSFKEKFKKKFSLIIFTNLLIISTLKTIDDHIQDEKKDCPAGETKCPALGGICLPSSRCPTPLSCPYDYVYSNQYSCSIDTDFIPVSQCPLGLECWDNTCISDESEKISKCPTMISCPTSKSIRCFDNSCVENLEDCPDYIDCPLFLPIRCPNGDCRQSLEDCPSLIICPKKLPVLCNDGSCHTLNDKCEYSSEETQCSDISMVRCPDGSCTSSKFLCATPMTCPYGYQKCYNGLCKPIGKCYNLTDSIDSISSTCEDENKVLCNFDFSCRKDISSCPTGIICPVDRPVKCWDNSCKENLAQCPAYQECPDNMIECPDGSCTINKCGTHITCSVDAPYRCYDNTCKKNPKDCPAMPSCPSDKPILCWDGRCLSDRGECLSPSECDEISPVKCPDGLCFLSGDSCKPIDDCPAEFDKCPDGSCMKSTKDCNEKECPLNFQNKCNNGMCVSNEEYCEKDNGCPWYKSYKCSNGECVENEKECIQKDLNCPDGRRRCPDGSCLPLSMKCPSESGCPVDSPIKCADGTCIKNNGKEKCPIPICPSNQPFRCENGLCVKTISSCPSEYKHDESNQKLVICADSSLAHFFDECKPIFDCLGADTFRCGDGSCRKDESYCPMKNKTTFLDTCPEGTSRCINGACSNKDGKCLLSNGCYESSENQYKCIFNGACVKDEDECEELSLKFNLANGCPNEYPVKCIKTNKCVTTESECEKLDDGCDQDKKMCTDGSCGTVKECVNITKKCGFGGKNFTCPGESSAHCADEFRHCYNKQNCQIDTPFRCLSGNCKKYPFKLLASKDEINVDEYCEIGIKCPEHKPYLCLDGSCVEKTSFCKSLESCPEEKQYRCFDRTCARSQSECEIGHKKCPGLNPILCPNGNCVSDIVDCSEVSCPSWLPYKCINGQCQSIPGECLYQHVENITSIDEKGKETKIEVKIYGITCRDDEYLCIDGTCRKDKHECPLYQGCTTLSKPYKCPDGSCADSQEKCNFTSIFINCENDTILCQDGLCRKECPEFNGCPNEKPLMCSNGHCVSSLAECSGYSSCISSTNPFRCADGSCVKKLSDCKSPLREFGTTNIILMTYPNIETKVPIVIGESNMQIAILKVPSYTFFSGSNSIETEVYIQSIPKSKYNDTYSVYNETRNDDVLLVYPYSNNNGNYKLDYEYTILSTVLNITVANENIIWNNKLILTLLYDFPYKHEGITNIKYYNKRKNKIYSNMPLDSLNDICLGKLEENERLWKCVELSQEAKSYTNLQLKASINSSGIYAVILNPKPNLNILPIEYNFYLKYLLPISLLIIFIITVLLIICYVFSRIYRYRRKYKATKVAYESTKIEYNHVNNSHIVGETIGDQEEGVVWTQNPTYRKAKYEGSSENSKNLEERRDKLIKRLKALEKNNKTLQERTDDIKEEIKRLKDYKAEISKNKID